MCAKRGFNLDWTPKEYGARALYQSDGLKKGIYQEFPDLEKMEPLWDVLYQEKKRNYIEILHEGNVELMPGAEEILLLLQKEAKKRCVVTHSPLEQIELIRKQLPILDTIPHWLTREHYSQAKPHPECYQKAISMYGEEGDRIIGFEDSPKGLTALLGTEAEGVLVSSFLEKNEVVPFVKKQFIHLPSLVSLRSELS